MSDKKKLFKDSRWNDTDPGITVGHENTTYENELNGLNEMMKSGLFDDKWYQKNLKIIKERYGIKDWYKERFHPLFFFLGGHMKNETLKGVGVFITDPQGKNIGYIMVNEKLEVISKLKYGYKIKEE